MPKARKSKKATKVSNAQSRVARTPLGSEVILPAMVALGCWGMSFSFAYFYNDPNHMIFAAMAALMALLWSYSVFTRIRKLRAVRQKSM